MNVSIKINNVYSKVIEPLPPEIKSAVRLLLSYEVLGARFSTKVQLRVWDGRKYFFTEKTQLFPTGLCSYVIKTLEQFGIEVEIIDEREFPTLGKPIPLSITLRNYQQDILQTMLECERGVVKVATGGGKSYNIAAFLGEVNVPSLIMVHRKSIALQLKREFEKVLGIEFGFVGDGRFELKEKTIALIQTVCKAYDIEVEKELEGDKTTINKLDLQEYIENISCVIVDEGHHIPSVSYIEVMKKLKNAYFRFSFTATPIRSDNADLAIETQAGRRIIDISASRLIREGYLSKPIITFLYCKHERQARGITYGQLYKQEIVNNDKRNGLVVDVAALKYNEGKTVLIAVTHIEHGKILLNKLQQLIPKDLVRFVNGLNTTEELEQGLKDLRERTLKIAICTSVWGEGIDLPSLNVLVNSQSQKTPVNALQLVGRVLRRTETKNIVEVFDIWDEGCRYFSQHSKERYKTYQLEPEYEIILPKEVGGV